MSLWRSIRDPQRHLGYKVCAILLFTLVIPSIATLMSVNEARSVVTLSDGRPLTPFGYTVSLSLFIIPVAILGFWFLRHPRQIHQRGAFWLTLGCLIPMGFLLDILWGCSFFTFKNRDAVMGVWVPARGGEVPLEEFFFYTFGFLAVLMTYIWLDEHWLRAYHIGQHRIRTREHPRLIQIHYGPLFIGAILFAAALAYKRFFSNHPEGLPSYFTFELLAAILPTMLLFRTAAPFINWRALAFTFILLLLVSLLWEATVALPYQWWGYQEPALIGITIPAWTNLPIEEPCLWSCVSIATIVWYEAMKVFLAMEGTWMQVLFGKRPANVETTIKVEPDPVFKERRARHGVRLKRGEG